MVRASRACSPGSGPRAAPRRRRWRSAGSRPWGPADGHPGACRAPQVHRRGQLHHPRADRVRLAGGDYGKSDVVGHGQRRRGAAARGRVLVPDRGHRSSRTSRSSCPGSCAARRPARRVMKTFMFTDIVGSTNLVEALGDEAWETILRWHNTALREVFTAHDGEEISTTGDGFFVSFDSPELAVAAAIAIQRRLAEHRSTQGFAPAGPDRPPRLGRDTGGRRLPRQGRPRGVAHRGARRRRRDRRERRHGRRVASDVEAAEPELRGLSGPIEVVNVDWR